MEKFNFKNNIGQENKLLQIEIYKFTNFFKLQNYTSDDKSNSQKSQEDFSKNK